MTAKADQLIARVLRISVDQVTDELQFQSIPQWDSLNHMNLILALEEECDVEIDGDGIISLTSVVAIRKFLNGRT